ncbi:hypothetical protein [Candidatus Babela massiliensis]|uniref:Uncharacterized protein n=1 Tax=Candidatus Babela massiliensis TaxID=673862 RepID=V6DHC6_9BACT|nr:hypothetical protein [Candidatus Babela massiliensis]CDK30949.1 hypothetical protein BABL1_gene_83 [Candidatus Babela massiliensis]
MKKYIIFTILYALFIWNINANTKNLTSLVKQSSKIAAQIAIKIYDHQRTINKENAFYNMHQSLLNKKLYSELIFNHIYSEIIKLNRIDIFIEELITNPNQILNLTNFDNFAYKDQINIINNILELIYEEKIQNANHKTNAINFINQIIEKYNSIKLYDDLLIKIKNIKKSYTNMITSQQIYNIYGQPLMELQDNQGIKEINKINIKLEHKIKTSFKQLEEDDENYKIKHFGDISQELKLKALEIIKLFKDKDKEKVNIVIKEISQENLDIIIYYIFGECSILNSKHSTQYIQLLKFLFENTKDYIYKLFHNLSKYYPNSTRNVYNLNNTNLYNYINHKSAIIHVLLQYVLEFQAESFYVNTTNYIDNDASKIFQKNIIKENIILNYCQFGSPFTLFLLNYIITPFRDNYNKIIYNKKSNITLFKEILIELKNEKVISLAFFDQSCTIINAL